MTRDELVTALREAGFGEEAERVANVTPKEEARFEEWLSDPANKAQWDAAIRKAREELAA